MVEIKMQTEAPRKSKMLFCRTCGETKNFAQTYFNDNTYLCTSCGFTTPLKKK